MADGGRLFGSRVIVTAAADGIGEATVRTFVKQGASVVAVDHPDSGVDSQFRGLKGVNPMPVDLNAKGSAASLVESANDLLGGLDVVVNNRAVQTRSPLTDADEAALQNFLDKKIEVYSAVSRAALPFLERSPAGRIVNIGCVRSAFAADGERAFARSQQTIAEFTRQLAEEAGPDGITVNYIQPGAIMTPDARRVFNDNKDLRDYCIRHSAARRLGEPVDVAKVALFLASDDAVFVSGNGIVVDGGRASGGPDV